MDERVIAYVDGYNLYHGLRDCGWKRAYWLDIQQLVKHFLKNNQALVKTKFFTTIVSDPEDKRMRQQEYLEALRTLEDLELFYGHFLSETIHCRQCGHIHMTHHEKMTDVNIAVELLSDAFTNQFDTALLVSADSDLVAAVVAVQKIFVGKGVVVVFPPMRQSNSLRRIAKGVLHVDYSTLMKSVFPDEIAKPDGFTLRRPPDWFKNVPPVTKNAKR